MASALAEAIGFCYTFSMTNTKDNLLNATHLNLINYIDDKTGASVKMWEGIYALPIAYRIYFV